MQPDLYMTNEVASFPYHHWEYFYVDDITYTHEAHTWNFIMIALVIWIFEHVTGTDPIGWLRVCSTSSANLMIISHKIKPVFKNTHGSVLSNWLLRASELEP